MVGSILSIPVSVSRGLVEVALGVFASWVASGTGVVLADLARVLTATTTVRFGAGFTGEFELVAELGAVLALPLLVLSAIQAIFRQDLSLLVRTVFIRVPLALMMGAAVVGVVHLSLEVTDAWSAAMLGLARSPVEVFLANLSSEIGAMDASGAMFALLIAGMATVGALALWVELAIRAAAIAVATLFTPLALCGLVLPQTAHLARRLGEVLAALILAKPVIAAVLAFAVSTVADGGSPSAVVEGIAVLTLAAAAPFALLRLVPLVEAGVIGHLETVGRHATGAVVDQATGAFDALGEAMHADDGYDPVGLDAGEAPVGGEEHERHAAQLAAELDAHERGEIPPPIVRSVALEDRPAPGAHVNDATDGSEAGDDDGR